MSHSACYISYIHNNVKSDFESWKKNASLTVCPMMSSSIAHHCLRGVAAAD